MYDDLQMIDLPARAKPFTDEEMAGWWDATRVGEWKGSLSDGTPATIKVTQDDIEQMAADYDKAVHFAPVTMDHEDYGTALGYVEQVRAFGDKLQAKISWTDSGRWLVQNKALLNRSAEIYQPMSYTKRAYLAGLTFLGAGKPAAKGLSPNPSLLADKAHTLRIADDTINLNETPESEVVEMDGKTLKESFTAWLRETFADKGDDINAEPDNKGEETVELKEMQDQNANLTAANAKLTADLAAVTEAKNKAEAKLAEIEQTARLSELKANLEKLTTDGKLTPAERDRELKLAANVPAAQFAEHVKELTATFEARSINALLGEQTKPSNDRNASQDVTRPSYQYRRLAEQAVDEEDKTLSLAACDLMDKQADGKLSFADALVMVRTTQK